MNRVHIINKLFLNLIIYVMILFVAPSPQGFSEQNSLERYIPIVSLYSSGYSSLIDYLQIYPDGKVKAFIPDADKVKCMTGKITSKQLENLINMLKSTGITDDVLLPQRTQTGRTLDHETINMRLVLNNRHYYLSSYHPFYEDDNNLVVTQEGVIELKPNEIKEAYFNEHASDEYKIFLKIWNQCFEELNNIYLNITGLNININPDLKFYDNRDNQEKKSGRELVSIRMYKEPSEASTYFIRIFDDGTATAFIPDDGNGNYKTIKLSPDRMEHVLNVLYNSGIDDEDIFPKRRSMYVHSGCRSILFLYLFSKEGNYHISSCHPVTEHEKGLVVMQDGVFRLKKNETKEQFLEKHASDDYKKFRKVWDQCFNVLNELYLEITGTNMNTYLGENCENVGDIKYEVRN